MRHSRAWTGLLALATFACTACPSDVALGGATPAAEYSWERIAEHASFPPGYNFPVHVANDGGFVALRSESNWVSRGGARWMRAALPASGMNSAYLSYVQHDGASWALGTHRGDYLRFSVNPTILRTVDHLQWVTMGVSRTLPKRVFYAAASFRGAMWMLGGFDGSRECADVWRSVDGLKWERVVERAPWSARSSPKAVVFRDRLYLLGGGVIDGPNSNDVWSSADGITWVRECEAIAPESPFGYSPVVFDDRIWLVGANRSGDFTSEMLVSGDGKSWRQQSAPWSPRGGVAVWTHGGALYLTGGKYSRVVQGSIVFEYCDDVWRMKPVRGR